MNLAETTSFFKALADRSRLLILQALSEKPQYLEELANRLDLATSTVSFHLKKLEQVNLVEKRKAQYYTIFFPNQEKFQTKLEEMMDFEFDEKQQQDQRILQYKAKVLTTFYQDGKIKQIPAQKQKRWIVFEPVLKRFEYGKDYSEQEVNEIIKQFHPDYCLIRRSFIEENVMSRKDNIYRITENYENFRSGRASYSLKHGIKESYEQSIRDKFGVE